MTARKFMLELEQAHEFKQARVLDREELSRDPEDWLLVTYTTQADQSGNVNHGILFKCEDVELHQFNSYGDTTLDFSWLHAALATTRSYNSNSGVSPSSLAFKIYQLSPS